MDGKYVVYSFFRTKTIKSPDSKDSKEDDTIKNSHWKNYKSYNEVFYSNL